MSLAEIMGAVDGLSAEELTELAAFIRERDNAAWDKQIDADSVSGKLDFLFDQAKKERAAGAPSEAAEAAD